MQGHIGRHTALTPTRQPHTIEHRAVQLQEAKELDERKELEELNGARGAKGAKRSRGTT